MLGNLSMNMPNVVRPITPTSACLVQQSIPLRKQTISAPSSLRSEQTDEGQLRPCEPMRRVAEEEKKTSELLRGNPAQDVNRFSFVLRRKKTKTL